MPSPSRNTSPWGRRTVRARPKPPTGSSGWCAPRSRGTTATQRRTRSRGCARCRRASAPGSPPEVVRGAFLGLGDVKLAQGDIPDALDNYQQVLSGGRPGDTLSQRAHEKINALGKADAPSTTPPKP